MNCFMPFILGLLLALHQANSSEGPSWNSLRVTWGPPDQIGKGNFYGLMPLTSLDAEKSGYVKVNGNCAGQFFGTRYYKPADSALSVLYDVNGFIAGIQINYLKRLMTHDKAASWFKQSHMFVENVIGTEEVYTLTGYFVDPAIICTIGRSYDEFENSNLGNLLMIQNGSRPFSNLIDIPLDQADLATTGWTEGRCFDTMGLHYWYSLTLDMDCKNFKPMFLLYDQGKLIGFGWAAIGNFQNSDRCEHPPKQAFAAFLNPVPNCLNELFDEVGGFTTMHVYMHPTPWFVKCPRY